MLWGFFCLMPQNKFFYLQFFRIKENAKNNYFIMDIDTPDWYFTN